MENKRKSGVVSPTLKEARKLYDLGFAIHWLRPRSKRPVESGWTTGPRKTWRELERAFKPGYNVGVRTGSASQIGEQGYYLACIDVDVKKPECGRDAVAALKKLISESACFSMGALPTVTSGAGNGSRHVYCVTKEPFKMITVEKHEGWEICVYSEGRQMVLPPSIHPSGARYEWGLAPSSTPPLLEFKQTDSEEAQTPARRKASADNAVEDFEIDETCDIRWLPEITDKTRKLIEKGLWNGKIVEDRSAYLLPAASSLVASGFDKSAVLTILTDPSTYLGLCAYDHAKTKSRKRAALWLWNYTVKKVMSERDPKNVFKGVAIEESELDEVDAALQSKTFEEERNWKQDLKRTKGSNGDPGKINDTLNNLDLILSNVTKAPLFQKNEFTNRETYATDAPWGVKKGSDLSDIDVVLIKSWVANSEFGFEPKNQNIEDAMSLLAYRHRTHPVRDWLNSLKWDGKPRVSSWIKTYLNGVAPEPYLSQVSKKFLIAMVARVFRPGCQWDYTLILEGRQGTRKSTAARVLASDKWFCDHLPDLKDKDAMLNLQGSWLVELGELKNVKHSDAATVKSYLTRRIDRVRAPYGHRWIDAPRQSVFIGTVNENEYFKDPTGNRRFWPVAVGECDVERLARDREQLFAEAKHLFDNAEEKLFLEGKALVQALEAQDDRRIDDDESEMQSTMRDYMNVPREEREVNLARFRMQELFTAPGAPWIRWNGKSYALQNGAQALRNLEFVRTKAGGQRIWHQKGASRWGGPRDEESFF